MKNTKFALVALIGLISLFASNAVWADDIVAASVSETFNGNSVCGPSGTSLCTESFDASFMWDNTTSTAVAGSLQFSAVGPLGTWGDIFGPVFSAFSAPSFDTVVLTAEGSFLDVFGFQFNISAQTPALTPGTYPLQITSSPGGIVSSMTCESDPCITDFFPFSGTPPPVLVGPSSVTATVSAVPAVPEPSSLLLLGTGLLGLMMGMGLYTKRLA